MSACAIPGESIRSAGQLHDLFIQYWHNPSCKPSDCTGTDATSAS